MSNLQSFLGIDVSMLKNVACIRTGTHTYRRTFDNSEPSHHELVQWAASKCPSGFLSGVEATGNYHKEVVRALRKRGFQCLVLNPRQVRDLAKGLGISCKTDRADAEVISQVLEVSKIKSQAVRAESHDDLRDISRQIQALTDLRSDVKHRFNVPSRSPAAKQSDAEMIDFIGAQILKLERQWRRLVKQVPPLKENYDHLLSVPNIGEKTARVLVSELPENLEAYNLKKVARYTGVTPCAEQSGNRTLPSRIEGGNPHIRKALFMPALSASSRDPEYRAFYASVRQKGKTHKQALVALMHKLIRRAAAVLIRRSPWEKLRPHEKRLDMA